MRQIIFPPEIQAYESRLSSKTRNLLTKAISAYLEDNPQLKLENWYEVVRKLQFEHHLNSPNLWAMIAKLAWILTDIEFFISNQILLKKFKDASLLTCNIGLGLAEYFDFEQGLTLLEKGFDELKVDIDKEAIMDIITPYSLVLNNSDNYEKLVSLFEEVQKLMEFDSGHSITKFPQLIPIYLFVNKKKKKFDIKQRDEL
ncbi:MAG: hypothetical protein ACW99R_18125, partial [Candidatus Hodarchaeales archaeon]